jgi:hypothetical protein
MDFSKFGEASEEWTSYVSAHPIIDQSWSKTDETLAEMHASGSAIRAELDREKLNASGLEGKFIAHDHEATARDGSTIPLRIYSTKDALP